MNAQALIDTAKALVADDKGILAMDESNPTCNKRFARLGIPQTGEALMCDNHTLDRCFEATEYKAEMETKFNNPSAKNEEFYFLPRRKHYEQYQS